LQTNSARYLNFNPLRFSLPPKTVREDRQSMIAKAAYFRAEQRNFGPGHELQDWLAAESEVDRRITQARLREESAAGWRAGRR
jgi:hypothetical protein